MPDQITGAEKVPITIVYKSGAKVHAMCAEFEAVTRAGQLIEVMWDSIEPRPLWFGVDNVAAVWMGHV